MSHEDFLAGRASKFERFREGDLVRERSSKKTMTVVEVLKSDFPTAEGISTVKCKFEKDGKQVEQWFSSSILVRIDTSDASA